MPVVALLLLQATWLPEVQRGTRRADRGSARRQLRPSRKVPSSCLPAAVVNYGETEGGGSRVRKAGPRRKPAPLRNPPFEKYSVLEPFMRGNGAPRQKQGG